MNLYRILAFGVLAIHLLWLVWILFGWLVTRGRPVLRWLHILSLLWGIVISVVPWFCPLTYAEQWLQVRAGLAAYQKSFLEHYLERLVYPDVEPALLMWSAAGVCLFLSSVHVWRFVHRTGTEW